MRLILLAVVLLLCAECFGKADTIMVYSNSMRKNVKCVVITPKKYRRSKTGLPVVYLLHGYSGDYSNWIKKVPVIDSLATVYKMIVVCPDAAYSSWYFDSPVDSSYRYETFTSAELPAYIDAHYKTIPGRKGRAVTGLSMGGFGAFFLTLRHPEMFGACGSMSGALDLWRIRRIYDISKRLGDTTMNMRYYTDWSIVNVLSRYNTADSLAMIIDCGIQDPFLPANRNVHEKMQQLKIPHDYIERQGTHDWKYWGNAVKYQLLFFREWFDRNK